MTATTEDEFRKAVRLKHSAAFALCGDLLSSLENAIGQQRALGDNYARAQDMLFFQAFKAAQSVCVLAELALVEDAATLARRLLELGMRAMYIEAKGDLVLRAERTNAFLAQLWHEWPNSLRAQIPEPERRVWEQIHQSEAARWKDGEPPRVRIKAMFTHADAVELYEQDYDWLCGIAHGVPPTLVATYATDQIHVHDDRAVPPVLRAAVRYMIMTAAVWNDTFELLDQSQLESLAARAEPPGSSGGS